MMKNSWRRKMPRAITLGAALCVLVPSAAMAAGAIETVVVTAEKRSEDVQKVPAAITAISGQDLLQAGIRQPSDLSRVVPSLTMAAVPGTSTGFLVDIRGQVASDVILNISQAVGLYEDGVNIPHPEGTDAALFDLDRVEVLRGPQGTLYGRNTTGGAINIITKGADFDGIHGYGEAEAGNFGDWKIGGAVNIPIIDDKLAVRAAYQHWSRDGYGSSIVTHEKLGGDKDQDIARVSLLFTPTSNLTVDLRGEYVNMHENGELITALAFNPAAGGGSMIEAGLESGSVLVPDSNAPTSSNPLGCFGVFPGTYPFSCASAAATAGVGGAAIAAALAKNNLFHNTAEIHQLERVRAWHADSNITWNVSDNFQIKSITGYHQFTDFEAKDLDTMPFQLLEIGAGAGQLQPVVGHVPFSAQPDQEDRFFSQEFDFSGKAFSDRLSWLVGAFYSDDKGHGTQPALEDSETTALTSTLIAFNAGGPPYSPQVAFSYDQKSVTDTSWAIFSQNDIKILDNLTATIGGRYTTDKLGQNISTFLFDASPYGAGGLVPPPAALGSIPTFPDPLAGAYLCTITGVVGASSSACDDHQHAKFSGYSYLLSLNWQINDDVMAYAKTSQGFRGGALQARAAAFPAAKPETAHDWELGLKSTFFDSRLRANFDLYETLYANKQETQIVVLNGILSTPIENAASAKIKGFEAEVTAIPIDSVTLGGTLTYLDAEYEKFATALTPQGGLIDASGFDFLEPHWRINLSARYDTTFWNGNLGLEADWAWRGETPINPLQVDSVFPAIQRKLSQAVGILNARIDYELPDNGWTVSLFSTNLTNKHYQTFGLDQSSTGGIATGITQEPRMYGIQIRKTFGGG